MQFTIVRNAPIVASPRGRKPTEFPLNELDVGDAFDIPVEAEDADALVKALDSWRRKVRVAVKALQKEVDCKFNTATIEGGLRVYRTA